MSKELETIKRVRAFLPTGLHVGGSYALKKFFYGAECIKPNDLDLFFYGDRPMEKWALLTCLSAANFELLKLSLNYDGKYKIEGQYWFIKARDKTNGVVFDLIFIHKDKIAESLGSTLAAIQYEVNYSEKVLVLSRDPILSNFAKTCNDYRRVSVSRKKNTDSQLEKVINRCQALDLQIFIND